ncbi:Two component regulator propeller [Flavobacterium glycines]|uniref:histidine kinase n=1 Tax=Flavobacterium glycines TaxID=551990 RepID=A0A1B9DGW7_9FLAO|nr:two-component regulator propeller domain-containing protein [Flavobacterium glycines]OCB68910.1 hybrid sensor histidine kinase/response regulator [Flavobacterium glycines]GEL11101.1 hybrid sensor histidine kinase/response regulator [Flavobacterium glycines]SDJ28705.1 Two component regulator propeller [Flavobacterium glycines]
MKKSIIIWLLIFISHLSFAQYSNLKFENFDTNKGLSSSTSVEIFQDSDGFLWFGTIDGLDKYDGYEFEIYRPVINDIHSISNNRINAIKEDSKGYLWVGTSNGLNVFDKKSQKFYRINLYKNKIESLGLKEEINSLLFDKKNNLLWVGTKNGLLKIDLDSANTPSFSNLKFTRYTNNPKDKKSIDNNNVTNIIQDKKGNTWIGTEGSNLHRYNFKTNTFDRVNIVFEPNQYLDHLPKQILLDKDGHFWIGNNLSHLYLFDINKNTFKKIAPVSQNIPVFHLYQDKKGTVWVSTDGSGLYLLDKNKGLIQHLMQNPDDPFSLPNNQPSKVLEDKEGIYWIASYNKGINKLALFKSSFGHHFYKANSNNGLSTRIAQSVIEDSKQRIWIGTDGGGLDLFNDKNGSFTHFKSIAGNPNSLSSNKILYLLEGDSNDLWVCTWDGGLNRFNTESGQVKRYENNPGNPFSIGQNTVWCAAKDNQKRLWLGTSTSGLNLFDAETEKFYQYKNVLNKPKSLLSNFVFSLFVDSKNRLWVGTSLGLCYVKLNNLTSRIPKSINFEEIKIKNIQGNRINHITEDYKGNIWVGSDMGLYELDINLKLKHSYSSKNGLPNNLVVGLQEDNNKSIWISTKSGLSLLNPRTQNIKNFNVHDGLQGLEFQSKSIAKTFDGRIIVGGLNGFNIFYPNDISLNSDKVKPIITDLKIFNKRVNAGDTINGRVLFDEAVSNLKEIELKYNEGYISFSFVALNYQNPERVKYAYKMSGLDNDYVNVDNNRVANYANLAPGSYTFEVMASIDGQWKNAEKTTILVKVLPPFWRTWWAYTLYVILFAALLWFGLDYYTNKINEEKEHELDQMKLRFFINVSHEFRTPLTLILNPVEKILSHFNDTEEVKKSALIIQKSSKRLLYLVDQLLDLRKMDMGKSRLELSNMDIVAFARDTFSLFEDLAKKKQIRFVFKSALKEYYGQFDPDKIEKMLANLLSNAIKFTDNGGIITLSLSEVQLSEKKYKKLFFSPTTQVKGIQIQISDTGIGFKKKQLKEVFQRFFHADSSKTGTGIGLNYTKSLVELHKGQITVESQYKKGTTFSIILPVDLKAVVKQKTSNAWTSQGVEMNAIQSAEYEIAISDEKLKPETVTSESDKEVKPLLLIVEDNKVLRNHLKSELKEYYQVKEATNGVEGLEKIRKYQPNMVISDVMMPKMDGFELCQQLKNDFEISHIPILLLTARNLDEDMIRGYQTGADAYLSKPFNMAVLKTRIDNLLEARKRSRERFAAIGGIVASSEITINSLDERFLDKATKVVVDNVSNIDFTLDDLIGNLGMGRSQFYRKINSLTGQNPSNFIRTIRLKYASEMLLTNQFSIKEVALNCGFNSTAYFTKTFKEVFKVTPTQYIQDQKDLEETTEE